MRLVCPNCGAQYEVDDRVIPENGRDVQCSNCGHTWFQRPAGSQADAEIRVEIDEVQDLPEAPIDDAPDISEAVIETETTAAPVAQEPEIAHAVEPQTDTPDIEAAAWQDGKTSAEAPATPQPVRRNLDENLQQVLREEAERE